VARLIAAIPQGIKGALAGAAACVSALVFGGSFMSRLLAITMLVRRLLAPERATAAIAALTCAFALGQAVGPIL
jgi:hypothetical protein